MSKTLTAMMVPRYDDRVRANIAAMPLSARTCE
jgi:hypothetical protein